MHVHSTFSDGAAELGENVERAIALGLRRLTCVDHVRRDTDWLPVFAGAVADWRDDPRLEVLCGIEAKILTLDGDLDMPDDISGADRVYVADHQMPGLSGPIHPREIRSALASGETDEDEVIRDLVQATSRAIGRQANAVIAHMFSILPKVGLDEARVPLGLIEELAEVAAAAGARIEIDERWSCPSPRTVAPFVRRGVEVLASTDSHSLDTLGQFRFVRAAFRELELGSAAQVHRV
jgi:putative hydrolase